MTLKRENVPIVNLANISKNKFKKSTNKFVMAEICKIQIHFKIKTVSKFKGPHVELVEVCDFLQCMAQL